MKTMLSVSEAAEMLGISESCLRNWSREGQISSVRTTGNHRRFKRDEVINLLNIGNKAIEKITIGYARVSTHDQKRDLETQKQMIQTFCVAKGYSFKIVSDLCSGLKYDRKGLNDVIEMISLGQVERIVIPFKDRLFRFGFELFEKFCDIHGVQIEIINQTEDKSYEEELVEDVLSIIVVFSAKLYGSRSHKNKKLKQEMTKMVESLNE